MFDPCCGSKDIFRFEAGGIDKLGRVYEYFIGEFASSEGKRGGEYFTPESIVKLLVAIVFLVEIRPRVGSPAATP
ncbi:MAG TPA: N-6 DNA methylase [Terrimicrobium sp.]